MFCDYQPIVLADFVAKPIAGRTTRQSLLTIELLFGWVAQSVDLIAALGGQRQAAE
jgi:hypothetical protein